MVKYGPLINDDSRERTPTSSAEQAQDPEDPSVLFEAFHHFSAMLALRKQQGGSHRRGKAPSKTRRKVHPTLESSNPARTRRAFFLFPPRTQLSIIERVGALLEKSDNDGQLERLENLLLQQLHVTRTRSPEATDDAAPSAAHSPSSGDRSQPSVDDNASLASPALQMHMPYGALEPVCEAELLHTKADDLEELFEADGCSLDLPLTLNAERSGGGSSHSYPTPTYGSSHSHIRQLPLLSPGDGAGGGRDRGDCC